MSGTADGEDKSGIVTAGLLVIGDEILSGRTKDKNIGFVAEYLAWTVGFGAVALLRFRRTPPAEPTTSMA